MSGLRKYITTPIFYVNSVPHIGHLYTAVVADTLARWYRFTGHDVKFVTGTDEHGLKIAQAAERHKQPVPEFCELVSGQFKTLFDRAQISYTDFIRTTEPRHRKACHKLWSTLDANGHLFKDAYCGWYSVSDEAFVPMADVKDCGNGTKVSLSTGHVLEYVSEPTTKFRLSPFSDRLRLAFKSNQIKVRPESRLNELYPLLSSTDMLDLSVSRPNKRVKWGILVPNDPDQIIYVWLDALTNYLTVCGYGSDNNESWWQSSTTNIIHVLGKDILKFHAVYWPAFLLAAEMDLPSELVVHAHWTVNKVKMSKSIGNVIDPHAVLDQFGVDCVRFYLMMNGGMESDGDWSSNQVEKVYRKELAGQIGNLYARATSPSLNPNAIFPPKPPFDQSSARFQSMVTQLPTQFANAIETRDFNRGMQQIVHVVAEANRYFDTQAPWRYNPGTRLDVIHHVLETTRVVALLLQCVMPTKASILLNHLGVPMSERLFVSCFNTESVGQNVRNVTPCILFPKLNNKT